MLEIRLIIISISIVVLRIIRSMPTLLYPAGTPGDGQSHVPLRRRHSEERSVLILTVIVNTCSNVAVPLVDCIWWSIVGGIIIIIIIITK